MLENTENVNGMWWNNTIPAAFVKVERDEFEHFLKHENYMSELYMGHRRLSLVGLWEKPLIAIETDNGEYYLREDLLAQV